MGSWKIMKPNHSHISVLTAGDWISRVVQDLEICRLNEIQCALSSVQWSVCQSVSLSGVRTHITDRSGILLARVCLQHSRSRFFIPVGGRSTSLPFFPPKFEYPIVGGRGGARKQIKKHCNDLVRRNIRRKWDININDALSSWVLHLIITSFETLKLLWLPGRT